MKALRSFAVRAALPDALGPLMAIAMNLRWTWNAPAVELFRWVDPEAWESSGHDPVKMLGMAGSSRLQELAVDGPFLSFLATVEEDLQRYLDEPRWFQSLEDTSLRTVAYFSPEFAVGEALPVYSGGLGVLSGDHLKAASDLGIPLVGVGLLYREGYFNQFLNADGWQGESYPALDPHAMPLTLMTGADGSPLKIEVDLAGERCVAQVWCAQIGRVDLLLLDSDVEENDERERAVTDRLYGGGGGSEHRLRQEILLGIGGVRALRAAGLEPDVFHSNEGHAGFLGLERIRELVAEGLDFDEALEVLRGSTVFTTHTPVPAGIDVFDEDLMERYFASFAKECETPLEDLLAVGNATPEEAGSFNMAVMGLRLAGRANGVSRLHGEVSRSMFARLWPEVPGDEVPIGSVTNGVHIPTWLGPEMTEVLGRHLAPGWAEAGNGRWGRVKDIPDAELWRALERSRERLVYFVRERLRSQMRARGATPSEIAWTDGVFDPGALTIGFARRFALYKRGTLVLRDPDRLRRLLTSHDRPVQIVIAGKSHPLDDGGKQLIQQLVHFAGEPELRNNIAFIENYDMEVGRVLVQGCDVWLNNPRRPLEACGTSGMKAVLNGGLNCSVLDGWWDESYDGSNGWAIGSRDVSADPDYQDMIDANAIYDLLEREIVPRFYDRSEGPFPRRWIERVKTSISDLGPFVTADRMVSDYCEQLYEPAARQAARLARSGYEPAKELAGWKSAIKASWDEVSILDVDGDVVEGNLGEERSVSVRVRLGTIPVDSVTVQLAHGSVGANGEIIDPEIVHLTPRGTEDDVSLFEGSFTVESPGLYGYNVRVVPSHPELPATMDMGLVEWAAG